MKLTAEECYLQNSKMKLSCFVSRGMILKNCPSERLPTGQAGSI